MFRILVCTTVFPFLVACGSTTEPEPAGDKTTGAEKPAAEKPTAHDRFPGFDAQAELALLNGKWSSEKGLMSQKAPSTWIVKDGALTIVEGETTTEAKLGMGFPGRIKVMTTKDGAVSNTD